MDPISVTTASSTADLEGILRLQRQNLADQLSPEAISSQGFVTVRHRLEDLERMHALEPSIIAKERDIVIAYILAMTLEARDFIPILEPMFSVIEKLAWQGSPLLNFPFLLVGQVCVDQHHRGTGLLSTCYTAFRDTYAPRYAFALTEIATRNTRSIRAHARVGFQTIHRYADPRGEDWDIVLWDWRA